jgi:hypothetical protein
MRRWAEDVEPRTLREAHGFIAESNKNSGGASVVAVLRPSRVLIPVSSPGASYATNATFASI